MRPDVAVIVPVYNRAGIVRETLDSVAAQTVRPAQLIVIDDGSTDGTPQAVSGWLAANRTQLNGQLIVQPNRGVSAARNRGLAAAETCRLVAFLDSDDRWPADFLERTAAALTSHPAAVAATVDRAISARRGSTKVQNLASLATNPIEWMLTHGAGIASASLFRREAIMRLGGFDETLQTGEDSALFLPLSLVGEWLHIPGVPVQFDRGRAIRGVSEGNLSEKYRDNYRRWACIYERFVVGCHQLDQGSSRIRRLLCKAWYRAGRELARGGSIDEARQCFRTALAWNRFHIKTHRRLALTYLQRKALAEFTSRLGLTQSASSPMA